MGSTLLEGNEVAVVELTAPIDVVAVAVSATSCLVAQYAGGMAARMLITFLSMLVADDDALAPAVVLVPPS